MTESKVQHFKSIDGLRAYMAWWVVVQHALQLSGADQFLNKYVYIFLTSGGIAVNVFIIISGYVITHLLLSQREPYLTYISKRFFRIFPLYVCALLVSVLLRKLYLDAFSQYEWIHGAEQRSIRFEVEENNFVAYFLAHLSLLHGVLPDSNFPFISSSFLAPAWSLSLEWQFYLIAPFLIFGILSFSRRSLQLAAFLAISVLIFGSGVLGKWDTPANIFLSLGYFVIGIATRFWLQWGISKNLLPCLFVIAFSLIAEILGDWKYAMYSSFATSLIWLLTINSMKLERKKGSGMKLIERVTLKAFTGSFAVIFGRASYATYLLHLAIFTVSIRIFNGFGGQPTPASYLSVMLTSFILIAIVSVLVYEFVERPAMRMGAYLRS